MSLKRLNLHPKASNPNSLTIVAVDLVIVDRVVRIVIRVEVAGVVVVLVLLNLSLLRDVVGVGRW